MPKYPIASILNRQLCTREASPKPTIEVEPIRTALNSDIFLADRLLIFFPYIIFKLDEGKDILYLLFHGNYLIITNFYNNELLRLVES